MNILNFFTTNTGSNNFITFGPIHLFILLMALVVSVFVYKMKAENRKLELFIGNVLIVQQVALYSWYFIGGFKTLTEGLPLFHCRIAIIFIGLGLILKKDMLMKIGSYIGIFGSIAALLVPGLDPFVFPHLTQFSYFIGHLFLLWGAIYLLFVKKLGMSKSDFKDTLIFINSYHLLMFALNNMIGSNYGYMNAPPFHIGVHLNPVFYASLVMMIFNTVLFVVYILVNKIEYVESHNEYSLAQ